MRRLRMKYGMVLAALLLLTAQAAPAQETAPEEAAPEGAWNVTSEFNVTLTQNAYSENWSGSESGSVSWAVNSNSLAEKQLTPSLHSATSLELAFGQTHSQDPETKDWLRPAKSTDLIDLESVLRFTRGWAVDPFASGRVESQFLDERNPESRRTFNPVKLTESVGVARDLIQEENRELSMRLGGALRQHIDRYSPLEEGDGTETVTTRDAGVEFVTEYRSQISEGKIGLESRLRAYNALYDSEEDKEGPEDGSDDWKSVDVDWENRLTANVTDYLMVNLYVQLLYDKEIDDDVMFKETLALGFSFQLL
ncbi:MAG: DUF3078 domain-containing protein [Candidatus Eisenbacteria bacterium]|nr:DUF3078 domain-containing protein [Candidatus Eisenbacteria bacterium]